MTRMAQSHTVLPQPLACILYLFFSAAQGTPTREETCQTLHFFPKAFQFSCIFHPHTIFVRFFTV